MRFWRSPRGLWHNADIPHHLKEATMSLCYTSRRFLSCPSCGGGKADIIPAEFPLGTFMQNPDMLCISCKTVAPWHEFARLPIPIVKMNMFYDLLCPRHGSGKHSIHHAREDCAAITKISVTWEQS